MRRALLPSVACALALGACGGDDGDSSAARSGPPRCTPVGQAATTVDIKPRWKAGETRSIGISKTREEAGEERRESSATADLTVLETGRDGSRLRWKTGDLGLPAEDVPADARDRLKDVTEGFEVVYTTDAGGAYEAKQNVGEIREQLGRVLDLLAEDPDQAQAIARTRELVLSDEFIQASVVREINALHGIYGVRLKEGELRELTGEIPNPFGGAAIRAGGTIELVQARDARGCAVVELDFEPRRADVGRALEDVFGEQANDRNAAVPRLQSTGRYRYDPGTGWVVRADTTQSVRFGDRSRTDITALTTRP